MRIVCVYVPNGRELTSEKYPVQARLVSPAARVSSQREAGATVVVCGDMNVTADDQRRVVAR